MNRLASHLMPSRVKQTVKADPRQVANSGGGFGFEAGRWTQLRRFLTIGSEGGTYYTGERELTIENAKVVKDCVRENGHRTVSEIVTISESGRAAKNEPALLALAICAKTGDESTRQQANAALPRVARTGTHLFHYAAYIDALGGWGSGTTRSFKRWYTDMPVEKLAYQAIKYQQRDGWSHRDLLRKAHPTTKDSTRKDVFEWMCRGWESVGKLPHPNSALAPIWAFEKAKKLTDKSDLKELCRLIMDFRLPHECVPNEMKKHVEVWDAMLPSMGITAMIRNLGKMTNVGLIAPFSAATRAICLALGDEDFIKKGRVHPISLLIAMTTYAQGHGDKGDLTWTPSQKVVTALDAAFYKSFSFVEHTGKNHFLAVDCSESMTWEKNRISGCPLNAREIAAAMALVTANVEPNCEIYGFSNLLTPLKISPEMRLDAVMAEIKKQRASQTDCSLPMLWAMQNRLPIDAFIVYTDNETNANSVHPFVALQDYRKSSGRHDAKLVVSAMSATNFTIADANDPNMIDVAGFDTSTPEIIANFVRG